MRKLPEVSILIITKNRRDSLKETLRAIEGLDYPKEKLEIVVVEETDNPVQIAGVKYVSIPVANRGYAFARNIAVKNSTKEFIASLDDDCIPTEKWLKELVSCFHENVAGVAGSFMVKDCNTIGYCENAIGIPGRGLLRIKEADGKIIPTRYLSTGNCVYKRSAVEEAGYFDESLFYGGEDCALGLKVSEKHGCVFNPKAIVYHEPYGNFLTIFKRFIKRGKSAIFFEKNLIPDFSLIKNSLSLRFLFVVIILYLVGSLYVVSFLLLYLFYYLFLFYRYSFQYKMTKNIGALFLTPVVKHFMDLGMELGIITGLFMKIFKKISFATVF